MELRVAQGELLIRVWRKKKKLKRTWMTLHVSEKRDEIKKEIAFWPLIWAFEFLNF